MHVDCTFYIVAKKSNRLRYFFISEPAAFLYMHMTKRSGEPFLSALFFLIFFILRKEET